MADSFLNLIRERFPEAESLAFERIFAGGHSIFFAKDARTLLPQFSRQEVCAALLVAKSWLAEAHEELVLTSAEERIFRGFLRRQ